MTRTTSLSALASFLLPQFCGAQNPPPIPPQPGPGHVQPRPDQPGPWDQDVLVYRVAPGGGAEKVATFGRAGVPTIARLKDGRLIAAHQHFPENNREEFDKVAVRFSADEGRTWSDPAVIRLDGLPEMNPQEGVGYHAVSDDGLRFTRADDVRIDGRRRWLGNAQSDGTKITFYGTGGGPPPGGDPPRRPPEPPAGGGPGAPARPPAGSIWTATSEDGRMWTPGDALAIPGADPGAVAASDGGLVIVVTGPPRPGTPSAGRKR